MSLAEKVIVVDQWRSTAAKAPWGAGCHGSGSECGVESGGGISEGKVRVIGHNRGCIAGEKEGKKSRREARRLKWRPRQGMPIDTFTRKKRCVALAGDCQSSVNDALPSTV